MKMRFMALFAGLLSVLPMTSAWAGGSTTTYYAALKASVSSTGGGKVYAGTSQTPGTYTASSTSSSQNSTTKDASKTFYAFAQADTGFEFTGWSTSDGGAVASTANPYAVSVKCSSTSSGSPTTTTVWANFSKIVLQSFAVSFLSDQIGGTFTVNGAAPPAQTAAMTEAYEAKLVATPAAGYAVKGWYTLEGGAKTYFATTASTSKSFTTSATVGVDFAPVIPVASYDELAAALATGDAFSIPGGETVVVPLGATLTIPSGKLLAIEGTLTLIGSLSNNGTISGGGKVVKVAYLISQGDVIKLRDGNGEECGNMDLMSFKPHYRSTTVTANSSVVKMGAISGCNESWAVLFNGKTYTISKQNPKALKVTFDTSIAANHIKSIADNADVDSIGDTDAVLLADCKIVGSSDKNGRAVYSKTVDCAGKTATMDAKDNSNKIAGSNALFLNGAVSISPTSENQNSKATFINCTSVTLSKIKGVSPAYGFYACGTKASPLSLTFGYYNSTRGDNYRTAYFHNGYYKYTFNSTDDGGGKCVVKGGNFRGSDPTAYIPAALNDVIWAPEDKTANYFVVQPKAAAEKLVSMNGVEYDSLEAALEAAPDNTKTTIELVAGLDLTGSTVTIGANKNVYLRLSKHLIEGAGKIVNNGTLTITDSAANECTVACAFENHGTLDFIFGKYTGDVVNKAGTLTVHGGIFTGSLTREAGAVSLKGGCFASDISSFVTADGYRIFSGKQPYCVCEMPNGTLYDLSVKGVMGYGATPYALSAANGHSADYDILSKYVKDAKKAESDYSAADWPRLAELVTFADVFNGKALDATLIFDRFVAKSSLTFNVKAGSEENACDFYLDLKANTPYRGLTEFLMRAPFGPYYAKTYEDIFAEEIKSVGASIVDKSAGSANAGTVCTFEIELWERSRGPNYASNGEMITNTICIVGSRRFTLGAGSNVAMIRPTEGAATFYPTLKAACEAAKNGETVMLANDCTTCAAIAAECSFRFDANGFAAPSGAFAAADGFEISDDGNGKYVVSRKIEIEVQTTTETSGEPSAQPTFNVEVTAAKLAELGVDTKADDVQEQAAEKLNERDESGLKNWEKIVVEQEKAKAAVPVLAKVIETVEVKDEGKQTVLTTGEKVSENANNVDLSKLPAGTYRKAYEAMDSQDKSVTKTIADPEAPTISIVRNESTDKTIVLPVPGLKSNKQQVTVADVIDVNSLTSGDTVTYCNEKGVKQVWTFNGVDENGRQFWEGDGSQGVSGSSDEAADECALPAGGAFWLTRVEPTKPVVIIAEAPKEIPAPEVRNNEWNLEANPDPTNEVALDDVVQGAAEGDEVIVQSTNGAQKRVTLNDKGEWTYKKSVKDENGRIKKIDAQATIGGGQGFWYISNRKEGEGKTSIKWK